MNQKIINYVEVSNYLNVFNNYLLEFDTEYAIKFKQFKDELDSFDLSNLSKEQENHIITGIDTYMRNFPNDTLDIKIYTENDDVSNFEIIKYKFNKEHVFKGVYQLSLQNIPLNFDYSIVTQTIFNDDDNLLSVVLPHKCNFNTRSSFYFTNDVNNYYNNNLKPIVKY
jgi:hypothetical protein